VRDLREIADDCYGNGLLITTSQAPINRWYDLIGVTTLADAILNRVVHNAYRIELSGLVTRDTYVQPSARSSQNRR
jgi:hypothetical protein